MRDGKRKKVKVSSVDYVLDCHGNKYSPPDLSEIPLSFVFRETGLLFNNICLSFEFNGVQHIFYTAYSLSTHNTDVPMSKITSNVDITYKDTIISRAASYFCYTVYGIKFKQKLRNRVQDKLNREALKFISNKWMKSDAWDLKLHECKDLLDISRVMSS